MPPVRTIVLPGTLPVLGFHVKAVDHHEGTGSDLGGYPAAGDHFLQMDFLED